MTALNRLQSSWFAVGLLLCATAISCKSKQPPSSEALVAATHVEPKLNPQQQLEREVYLLDLSLKTPNDYVVESAIEIDSDNLEEELAQIKGEIEADSIAADRVRAGSVEAGSVEAGSANGRAAADSAKTASPPADSAKTARAPAKSAKTAKPDSVAAPGAKPTSATAK